MKPTNQQSNSAQDAQNPQHTAGPWTIEYAETSARWPVIMAGEHEVAEISDSVALKNDKERWRKKDGAEVAEANARLIAAAPELFDFVAAYVEDADCGDGGQHDEDMSHGRCWHCTASRIIREITATQPA